MSALVWMLMLSACTTPSSSSDEPAVEEAVKSEPVPEGFVQIPRSVVPHCMSGLDAHAPGVRTHPKGGYKLRGNGQFAWFQLAPLSRVVAVNDQPVGTSDQWFQAMTKTEGQTLCTYALAEGEPLKVALVGSIEAEPDSRNALAALALDPYLSRRDLGPRLLKLAGIAEKDKTASRDGEALEVAVRNHLRTDLPALNLTVGTHEITLKTAGPALPIVEAKPRAQAPGHDAADGANAERRKELQEKLKTIRQNRKDGGGGDALRERHKEKLRNIKENRAKSKPGVAPTRPVKPAPAKPAPAP